MRQLRTFGDERTLTYCTFCGEIPDTKDHCPSKVFLNEPYPENLPVVPSCLKCNRQFSIDEEYVACLMSCIVDGTVNPEEISRPKIQRILKQKESLLKRIEQQLKILPDKSLIFEPEVPRLEKVLIKLAQGHVLHEIHEHCIHPPSEVRIIPVSNFSSLEWSDFANPEPLDMLPEVGSRAMLKLSVKDGLFYSDWIDAQTNIYSYYVSVSQRNIIEVRIFLLNYFACFVVWEY